MLFNLVRGAQPRRSRRYVGRHRVPEQGTPETRTQERRAARHRAWGTRTQENWTVDQRTREIRIIGQRVAGHWEAAHRVPRQPVRAVVRVQPRAATPAQPEIGR